MKRVILGVVLALAASPAFAQDLSTTTTVVPGSTTTTVVPGSTTVTLPNGIALPPGAQTFLPPGLGAPGTVTSGAGNPPEVTKGEKIEVTEGQLESLSPEQRAAVEKALESAKASMPQTQSAPAIPDSIAGLNPDMLKSLTPEQLKLVEQAKETGVIPAELKSLINNLSDIPGDVYAKLSPQQKDIIEKARASGVLDKAMLNDVLDGLTPAEIKAFTSGSSVSTSAIQKAAAKRTITCTKGKKTVKLVAKSCPSGFKKG